MEIILQNKSLKELCTFHIGGEAKYFCSVTSIDEMRKALTFAHEKKLRFFILGKGSNLLFDDRGFDGLVIQNRMEACQWNQNEVEVEAGYSFSKLGIQSAKKRLSGLEFAAGIPASVGGAICMNAGAHHQDTKETLKKVWFLSCEGKEEIYNKEEVVFGYRFSEFQQKKGAILKALFVLKANPKARQKQSEWMHSRIQAQPLREKSAGCIFKNPSSQLAAAYLIDQCGLKGFQIGGAKVSMQHANFIVNEAHATSQQVLELVAYIQKKVAEIMKVRLEMEVRYVPFRE